MDLETVPLEFIAIKVSDGHYTILILSADATACLIKSNHRRIISSSYRGRSELKFRNLFSVHSRISIHNISSSHTIYCKSGNFRYILVTTWSVSYRYETYSKSISALLSNDIHTLYGDTISLTSTRSYNMVDFGIFWDPPPPPAKAWKGGGRLDLTLSRILLKKIRKQLNNLERGRLSNFISFMTSMRNRTK